MPEPLDDEELGQLMRETRTLVDALRAGEAPNEAPDVEGRGETADERVRVTVRAGRVDSIVFDPRLLRLSPGEFADAIRDGVNAALGDFLGRSASEAVPDLAALSEMMRRVQNEGLRQMAIISDGIADAMAKIRGRTYISGDPTPHGLEQLLSLAQSNVDDALAVTGGQEDARGEGSAARGKIRVVAAAERVESVTVDRQTMRMASHELAEQLTTAVNSALDDVPTKSAEQTGVNVDELRQRVREVQDMSLEQMHSYTRALRDIMRSIGGPE
ncbi:hypothetical protein [Actinoallomurus sp. NPDC050550]|uniref:hypothetical protein n=1 Tax=Actinoallomurus sp. NPDC050550 TaxID=3154937 RepID=UPI0033D15168